MSFPSGDRDPGLHGAGDDPASRPDAALERDLGDAATDAPVNGTAVASIVIAVGNIVFGSFLGLFLPVLPVVIALVAVALGHLALARIRRTGESGRGLALSALAVGYVWLAVTSLLVAAMLLFTGYGLAVLGF